MSSMLFQSPALCFQLCRTFVDFIDLILDLNEGFLSGFIDDSNNELDLVIANIFNKFTLQEEV